VAVAGFAIAAFGLYAWLLLARDTGLATYAYDQAFFQQLVWNLDQGRWFVSSFSPGSFLGLHFEPLLVVPALFELLWSDARMLSMLAAAAIGAVAPAAFLFLRSLTRRPVLAAALAAPLPFWPALQEAARAGFHPEVIGVVLALLAGWAGLERRPALCWILALAALTAKEDQAWNVLVVGLAMATAADRMVRPMGIRLAMVAVLWGVAVTGLAMPLIRAGRQVDTSSYYGWLAHATPGQVMYALATPGGWASVALLLLCAAGLPLLRPRWLLFAVPPLVADLLSAHPAQSDLHLQYALPLVVPLLVAAGKAAPAIARLQPAAFLAIPAMLAGLLLGSLPPAIGADATPFRQPAAIARLQACLAQVPPGAPLAADDPLLPALASRTDVRELTAAQLGDYLVIDRQARLPGYVVVADRLRVMAAGNRPATCDDGRFLVLGPTQP
jgi:uncharacterized membrane protein